MQVSQLSAGKIMGGLFLQLKWVICVEFLPYGVTIKARYYSKLLHSDLHQAIQKRKTWETVKEEHPTA
jgi:hypothetical protein